jgi:hypothetical protein
MTSVEFVLVCPHEIQLLSVVTVYHVLQEVVVESLLW